MLRGRWSEYFAPHAQLKAKIVSMNAKARGPGGPGGTGGCKCDIFNDVLAPQALCICPTSDACEEP